jgi:thymidine phosphorylase
MDVKCGQGAFMKTRDDARALAQSLVAIGNANGVRTEALITAMDAPLGKAVGNALEVIECFETLRGRGPRDLETLSVTLAAHMVRLGGKAATVAEAETQVRAALTSGRGLEKFRDIIAQQGGDPKVVDDYSRLPAAPHRTTVTAERSGYVAELDAEAVGRATCLLGAGRNRVEDAVDHAVGAIIHANRGAAVQAGDPMIEVHYRDDAQLAMALAMLRVAYQLREAAPVATPLIYETIA